VSSNAFVTSEIRECLRKPTFDNWLWDDAEMIILLREMFIDLDLLNKCHIDVCTCTSGCTAGIGCSS